MRLVSFSIVNYRSITKAKKIPLDSFTILVGPNNEGKSNILRALVSALKIVDTLDRVKIAQGKLFLTNHFLREIYTWKEDFPISIQKSKPDGTSKFTLEFKLDETEIIAFKNEVKSDLNGNLPIEISIGHGEPKFKVAKRGRGGKSLSKKSAEIGKFIGSRVRLEYFPTIRTANTASGILNRLIAHEVRQLESSAEFKQKVDELRKLQLPHLKVISEKVSATLREFLPSIKNFEINIGESAYIRAFERSYDLLIDDGSLTKLSAKGNGVQSLVALGLIRHGAEKDASGKSLLLAIEEPESHLHPTAIQRVRKVLEEISKTQQVIITTHCPLFVNRTRLSANVVVTDGRALPADEMATIREVLGVRVTDNLSHADLVLVVEGEDDRRSLTKVLSHKDPLLRGLLEAGTLALESLGGGTNLGYKLSSLRESIALYHCLLDNDETGRESVRNLVDENLLQESDYTLISYMGMANSEWEDILNPNLYKQLLLDEFGIDINTTQFRGNQKWSERLRKTAQHQGKMWNDSIKQKIKNRIADLIESHPHDAIDTQKEGSLIALIDSLKRKAEELNRR